MFLELKLCQNRREFDLKVQFFKTKKMEGIGIIIIFLGVRKRWVSEAVKKPKKRVVIEVGHKVYPYTPDI